jgi:hypothetical protein
MHRLIWPFRQVAKSVIPSSKAIREAVPSLAGNAPPLAITEYRFTSYRELVEFAGDK